MEDVRGRGKWELGWEETVVELEGVLGKLEVWRKTFEIDGEEGEKEAVWKGNWVEWQRERRIRATMDNGAKEKSASA